MHIILSAIGKLKGIELTLYDHYAARVSWKISLHEYEIKKPLTSEQRKTQEAAMLLAPCKNAAHIIALDEKGTELSSGEFAKHIQKCQIQAAGSIAFIIGGADGLDDSIRKRASLLLSFGRVTWPHLLIRGMLMEQLYRAQTIISGHPYHRP